MPGPNKRLVILDEKTVRRDGASEEENPYWELEEPAPHPDPARGCIRRGLCCKSSPGWFAPGEVERAAAMLGMSPDAFVRAYVVIDHVEINGQLVEAFAPAKVGRDGLPLRQPGTRTDRLYRMLRSPCIFYDGQGCRIYPARPIECRRYVCTQAAEDNLSHEEIGRMWLSGTVPPE